MHLWMKWKLLLILFQKRKLCRIKKGTDLSVPFFIAILYIIIYNNKKRKEQNMKRFQTEQAQKSCKLQNNYVGMSTHLVFGGGAVL